MEAHNKIGKVKIKGENSSSIGQVKKFESRKSAGDLFYLEVFWEESLIMGLHGQKKITLNFSLM